MERGAGKGDLGTVYYAIFAVLAGPDQLWSTPEPDRWRGRF